MVEGYKAAWKDRFGADADKFVKILRKYSKFRRGKGKDTIEDIQKQWTALSAKPAEIDFTTQPSVEDLANSFFTEDITAA